ATDVDLVLVEDLATLGSPFFADDDREHARMVLALEASRIAGAHKGIHPFSRVLSTFDRVFATRSKPLVDGRVTRRGLRPAYDRVTRRGLRPAYDRRNFAARGV